jgi:type II secretory pathway pseudopilin PulG
MALKNLAHRDPLLRIRRLLPAICAGIMKPIANQGGMAYLFVMIIVALMGIALMGMNQQWSVMIKRDREAELLFRGTRIQEAIDHFVADYEIQKATRPNRWPRSLQELTKKSPKRYLQRAYEDPITGEKFALIQIGEELHGVHSTSTDAPYNQVKFKGVKSYEAIRFEATGAMVNNCQPNPLNPMAPTCSAPPPQTGAPQGMPAELPSDMPLSPDE